MKNLVDVFINSTKGVTEKVLIFIPKFFAAFVLFIIGLIVAKLLQKVFTRLFVLIGIDRLATKSGIDGFLKSAKIEHDLSWIFARILYWMVLLIFFLPISDILQFAFFAEIINQTVAFIPNIFIAMVVVLIGSWTAKFLGNIVQGSAVRLGSEYAEVMGVIVNFFILLIVFVIALFQLRIEVDILSHIILIVISMASFGLALTFALGAKDMIKNIIVGIYINHSLKNESFVKVRDVEGKIVEIGPIATVIESSDGKRISIPNIYFVENT